MKSGSSPCAPRYLELTASAEAPTWLRAPKSPPEEPEIRELAPVSAPLSCAITRSTGPPGANCTTTKETNRIPSRVGSISRMRRAIYALMCYFACSILAALLASNHHVSGAPRA